MAAHWPSQPDSDPFAAVLNGLPKYVASRTLSEPLEWKGSSLLQGDVAAAVAELKEEESGGALVVLGSGELVRTLLEHDLVDELQLMIDPIVIGSGKRLFPQEGPIRRLRLVNSTTTGTGMLITTYAPEWRRRLPQIGQTSENSDSALIEWSHPGSGAPAHVGRLDIRLANVELLNSVGEVRASFGA
jgi:dihydrofolate reductase